jgi:hypothetical protein
MPDVSFTTLVRGDSYTARWERPTLIVAGTPAEAVALNQLLADFDATANAAGLDWNTTVVVALARERVGSGGYGVTIERLTRESAGVRLVARLTAPSPGSMVTEALTVPYHVVAVARDELPDASGTPWTAVNQDGVFLAETTYP